MGKIRVLELIQGLAIEGPLGGIERFGIELVRALDGMPIEPILCGLWRYGTPYEEPRLAQLHAEGLQVFFAASWDEAHPYGSFLRAWRGITEQLDRQSVHLIHSHCQFGDGLALLAARPLQAQALLRTVHNEREWPKRPGRRLVLTNLLYPLVFQLEIGVSQKVVSNLDSRPMARLLGRRGLCIHNALNLERFSSLPDAGIRARKREELGLPTEAVVIGTIGRLTVQKGYSVLIQSVPLVLREVPSACFVIIGEGELENELRELAMQLGVAQAVRLTGPRQDIKELIATMDLFASSSLWEGLPTVILESMAAQIPVVATDVSGTRELVQDGVTGLLVPADSPESLARAILQMLREREQARAMAERAHEHVQNFSIVEVAKQHVHAYQQMLKLQ